MSDITSAATPGTPIDLFKTFSLESQKGQPVDPKKVAQLAQEFEAMLMLQMVRQMRQSISFDDEKEQGFGNETMTDTFDVEFSRYLAQNGGIGVGKMIQDTLLKQQAAAASSAAGTAGATSDAAKSGGGAEPAASSTGPSPLVAAAHAAAVARAAAATGSSSAANLTMPLEGAKTTSGYGWRNDPLGAGRKFHAGVDLRAAYGTEVPAAAAGEVTFAGDQTGYGTTVVIRHGDGFETRYAHLSSMDVQAGDQIQAGQSVGRVGNSGRSTGPHLHFEVRRNGQQVDPAEVTGSSTAAFKFVTGVDDSLHERMLPGGTVVPLTDDPGVDDEDPGRKAR
jgi:murein DD-endopeptidase MepM/ murein hydrolase activator NlpD